MIFGKIFTVINVYRKYSKFVKEMDAKGITKFSDDWFLGIRRQIEGPVMDWLLELQNKGLFKLIKTDNQLIRGIQIVMKSNRLDQRLKDRMNGNL